MPGLAINSTSFNFHKSLNKNENDTLRSRGKYYTEGTLSYAVQLDSKLQLSQKSVICNCWALHGLNVTFCL